MKKAILRAILNKYKNGQMTKEEVYQVLLETGIMKATGPIEVNSISGDTIKLLDPKAVIIFKKGA